jgi:hypothetical protein
VKDLEGGVAFDQVKRRSLFSVPGLRAKFVFTSAARNQGPSLNWGKGQVLAAACVALNERWMRTVQI